DQQKSTYGRGVPDPKIRIYDVGTKKGVDDFPFAFTCGADRLQTGMRSAFGKPQGTCACESNANHAEEALRRAKFKFPVRQKIIRSRKWYGFTKFVRAEYLKYKSEGRIAPDDVNAT
ncbi:hypothetical protein ACJX0J_030276, partial [Zea mays]